MRLRPFQWMVIVVLAGCSTREPPPPAVSQSTTTGAGAVALVAPVGGTGIEGVDWAWLKMISPADSIWQSPDRARYTLRLDNGRAAGAADCNRFTGPYTLDGRALGFGALAMTRAMCPPGSLGDRYVRWLGQVSSQFARGDTLFLELKFDSGTMVFVK